MTRVYPLNGPLPGQRTAARRRLAQHWAMLAYLGGAVHSARPTSAARGGPAPGRSASPKSSAQTIKHAEWMIGMAMRPWSALLHVGLGSFLSMQAFFGATFIEAAGPVVAIGLLRNVAPLMVGFLVSGLFTCSPDHAGASSSSNEARSGHPPRPVGRRLGSWPRCWPGRSWC